MADQQMTFEHWIEELDETVIQGEYGYERGEFNVSPENWRPMYDRGLSPREAFQHALDAHGAVRQEDERLKRENWERICREEGRAS